MLAARLEVGDRAESRFVPVDVLVSERATHTTIPADLLNSLGVEPMDQRIFVKPDGGTVVRDVGQAHVRIQQRSAAAIVVFGIGIDAPVLGGVTLSELGLTVDASGQRLVDGLAYAG